MPSILVACESSGVVRAAFAALGWDAWSCDLLPAEGQHIQGDAVEAARSRNWDLMIAHPPCTYLSSSGLHWNKRVPGREEKTAAALQFVRDLMDCDHIPHIAIENPVGRIGTTIRKADQYVQPYEYGHDASKRTGLWLKNLPKLVADREQYVWPRFVGPVDGNLKKRWANQTDSGQNRLPPSEDRWQQRSETYAGIAKAMAEQWSHYVNHVTKLHTQVDS